MSKLLLYCTKAKPYLEFKQIPRTLMEIDNSFEGYRCSFKRTEADENFQLNGKIIAECDYEVEEFDYMKAECLTYTYLDLLNNSCLTDKEMYDYLKGQNGYVIHIKNLHIFDEPRELDEYYSVHDIGGGTIGIKVLTKAPQNMMRVSKNQWEYDFFYEPSDINILISIQPEWLCKILNGEKTIEVRKKVLKEMLK